jgi:hypothetical protein
MITRLPYLTIAATLLIALTAKADDFAWGATTGSSMIEIDATATTATLVGLPYGGTTYYSFKLLAVPTGTLNGKPNNVALGSSLWLAQNSNGTLYGMDNGGTLYTISTTLSTDQNGDIGFVATPMNVNLGINVTGAAWISSNLLDISSNQNLYQYNLATNAPVTSLGSLSGITGLAYNGALYGVQFSPSPGEINYIAGVNLTNLAGSSINGLSQGSSAFAGTSLLYVSDGNSGFYSYNTATTKLNTITNALGSGIHSLTPLSVSGGGATPTPSPTATPTPTPTATPTPSATPIVYNVPIIGGLSSLNVIAPETTPTTFPGPASYPKCAPGYTYTSTPTASFAAGAKIDPAGTLGVYRYYQKTTDGVNYSPATAASANPVSTVWAWASGTTSPTHAAIAYTAGVVGATGTPFYYGREILELEYLSGGVYTILDTKTIYEYPWNYNSSQTVTPSVLFSNAVTGASDQAASNPSPYASPFPSPSPVFQGDSPRFTVAMNNLYPAGATSVIIYSGTPASNPTASGQQTVAITSTATPNSGLWTTAPKISFEVAPYINTSATTAQTYTIAAIQTLPGGYATSSTNPAVLNTLTFTTTSGFNVNGTVGTVK